jgi:hypothetical protein
MSGTIKRLLTTTLAHSSGGVAVVGMAALPDRRDGGAATDGGCAHLRKMLRLFSLVGIAGEDDLDEPDLAEGAKADAANKTNGAGKSA